MKIPVFVYMAAIVAMSVCAFLRFSAVGDGLSAEYIFYTFLGSVLFVASDSILAMTVFKRDVGSFMEVGVMITYVFAQFLIMWGCNLTALRGRGRRIVREVENFSYFRVS